MKTPPQWISYSGTSVGLFTDLFFWKIILKYNIVFKNCDLNHQIWVNVQYIDAYLVCIYDPHIKEEVGTLQM